ncbi:MAG: hypothetical protein H6858_03015 [Rhodospirillales bacterium]|nr:hypothetical protein [Alphaproteobacteria bacterium]MCB1839931.1 hypothetical protein [Alphaproteobacteria bacterium]MCB9976554.1 hypothetical protein [Rhodospirillales bacterium]
MPYAAQTAYGMEMLNFEKQISPTALILMSNYVQKNLEMNMENFKAVEIDLNRDGLNEYIIRQKKCYGGEQACTYYILAESRGNMVLLGKIRARNLALGGSYTYGVQDILAFQSNNNDYEYDIFIWDPPSKMYILKRQTAG